MAKEKQPKGRPPMKVEKLPKNWKDIVINGYSNGYSDVEIRVDLDISNSGWYSLLESDADFNETIKRGKQIAEAWWMRTGRTGLWQVRDSAVLNTGLWFINMKNRFGWTDKKDEAPALPQKTKVTLNIDA